MFWSLAKKNLRYSPMESLHATKKNCVQQGVVKCPDKIINKCFRLCTGACFWKVPSYSKNLNCIISVKKLTWKNQPNKSQRHIRSSSHLVRCKQLGSPRPSWTPRSQAEKKWAIARWYKGGSGREGPLSPASLREIVPSPFLRIN